MSLKNIKDLQKKVLIHWKEEGRHDLPWRKTKDPYKILVSEVMLQQTQVERVVPYYKKFLVKFPTPQKLAAAELSSVLKLWSGLGYNRRGKFLHDTARVLVKDHGGKFPHEYDALRKLPGVGDYTARAVRVFAFNEPDVLIETNIRTVYLHETDVFHAAHGREADGTVRDEEILQVAEKVAMGQDPRTWHWALMDYGAHLKRSGIKLNAKSKHYAKQSKFEGSLREVRGAILRAYLEKKDLKPLRKRFGNKFAVAYGSLKKENLIQ